MADRSSKDNDYDDVYDGDDDADDDDEVVVMNDDNDDDDDNLEQAQRRRRQCFNCCAIFEDVADNGLRLCLRCATFHHCTGCKWRLPNSCFSTTANDDHTYHRVLCLVCSRVNNLLVINELN